MDIDCVPEYLERCYDEPVVDKNKAVNTDLEKILEFFSELLMLSPKALKLIVWKLKHWDKPVATLAREMNISDGQAHRLIKQAMDEHPILKSAIRIRKYRKGRWNERKRN